MPGWVRRQCAHKYYHDIDIVNCYPVILLQLQEKVGVNIDPIHLMQYVEDREKVLQDDMQRVPGLTREEAKLQYLKVMFGGEQLEYETPFLLRYKAEINYITEHLWHMREYRNIRSYAECSREEKKNIKASFLSVVITTVERQIIDTAMARVSQPDMAYTVDAYVFDGFMVRKKTDAPNASIAEADLAKLSEAVLQSTGYVVRFIEKSLKPTIQDVEKIYPPFNNMVSICDANPDTVFTELSILARDLNANPRPENVQLFQRALVPVMNKAFARLQVTVALVVVRRVSDKGPNDVRYDRMKIADVQGNYKQEAFFIHNGEKPVKVVPISIWLNSRYV